MTVSLHLSKTHSIRYGHEICEDEKKFVQKRKGVILEAMKKIFPEGQAPRNIDEVNTVRSKGVYLRRLASATIYDVNLAVHFCLF